MDSSPAFIKNDYGARPGVKILDSLSEWIEAAYGREGPEYNLAERQKYHLLIPLHRAPPGLSFMLQHIPWSDRVTYPFNSGPLRGS